jgi:hypothetical protein
VNDIRCPAFPAALVAGSASSGPLTDCIEGLFKEGIDMSFI